MKRALLCVMCVGCRGGGGAIGPDDPRPTHVRTATDPLPGLLWATPAQPWRIADPSNGIALSTDGALVMIASQRGRVVRYDAKTGLRLGVVQLPTALPIAAVLGIGADRWFALAQSDRDARKQAHAAFEISAGKVKEIALPAVVLPPVKGTETPEHAEASVALAPDGGVVFSGAFLPLAAYDPETWKVRATYSKAVGWTRVRIGGTYVLADRSLEERRFDLRTKASEAVSGIINQIAADGRVVDIHYAKKMQKEVRFETPGLPFARDATPFGTYDEVAADPVSPRLIVRMNDELQVVGLDGKVGHAIALGSNARASLDAAAIAGDRIAFVAGSVLRVADLAAGTVSPAGDGPYESSQVAVTDDGAVIGHDSTSVWELAGGKRVHAVDLGGDGGVIGVELLPRAPRLVVAKQDQHVALYDPAEATPRKEWTLPWKPLSAFATRDGSALVVESEMKVDYPFDLVRIDKSGAKTVLFQHNWDSDVSDLDPERGDALVTQAGRVGVVTGGKPELFWLRVPDCAGTGSAELEPDGDRAATWNDDTIAVWDRRSGAMIAAARLETTIARIEFVPKSRELAIATLDGLVLWTPNGDARTIATQPLVGAAISPNGARAALAYESGRLAVIDLAAARTATPVSNRLARPAIPAACGTVDVFDAHAPADQDDPPPPEEDPDGCEDCGD